MVPDTESADDRLTDIAIPDWLSKIPVNRLVDIRHIAVFALDSDPIMGPDDSPEDLSHESWGYYSGFCRTAAVLPCRNAKFLCYFGEVACPIFKRVIWEDGSEEVLLDDCYVRKVCLPMWSLTALEDRLQKLTDKLDIKFDRARSLVGSSSDEMEKGALAKYEKDYQAFRVTMEKVVHRIRLNKRSAVGDDLVFWS